MNRTLRVDHIALSSQDAAPERGEVAPVSSSARKQRINGINCCISQKKEQTP